MPTLCQVSHLSHSFETAPVFDDLNFTLSPGLCGLVGANGRGKTVLLRLLAGQLRPTAGTVHWSVPFDGLEQLTRLQGPRLADALSIGGTFDRFRRIEQGRPQPDDLDAVAGLWHLPAQWEQRLDDAGIRQPLDAPAAALSGGEQTRLALCRLFLQGQHYLLLDEPSNHLDARGREWLLQQLHAHRGGALIASHDRRLLRDVDRILELQPQGLREYGGGYERFRGEHAQQTAALAQRASQLETERRRLRHTQQRELERAAQRRQQGERLRKDGSESLLLLDARKNRAEAGLGKLKQQHEQRRHAMDEALNEAREALEHRKPQRIVLADPMQGGGLCLHLQNLCLPHGDARPISINIHAGERWRLRGDNGSGKSTLLQIIAGRVPAAGGHCRMHGRCLYLDQHFSLLDPGQSALDNLRRLIPERTDTELRTQLGALRLRGDKALQTLGRLSGGERLKVALLAVTGGAQAPELLLLDEPDNHLDLDSKQLLEHALADYPGTLLWVSHDEDFSKALRPDHELTLQATT